MRHNAYTIEILPKGSLGKMICLCEDHACVCVWESTCTCVICCHEGQITPTSCTFCWNPSVSTETCCIISWKPSITMPSKQLPAHNTASPFLASNFIFRSLAIKEKKKNFKCQMCTAIMAFNYKLKWLAFGDII